MQARLRGIAGLVPIRPMPGDGVSDQRSAHGPAQPRGDVRSLTAAVAQVDQRHLADVGQHRRVRFPAAALDRPAELVLAEQLRPADAGARAAIVEGAFLRHEGGSPSQKVREPVRIDDPRTPGGEPAEHPEHVGSPTYSLRHLVSNA